MKRFEFDVDIKERHYIIIEAESEQEALSKAKEQFDLDYHNNYEIIDYNETYSLDDGD